MKRIAIACCIALSGCSTMEDKAELTWQAINVIDVAQTYQIASNPHCFHEANPVTRALIGEQPSRTEVIAWGAFNAATHALITHSLERWPKAQTWWQRLSIGFSAYTVGSNYSIGVRIGGTTGCDKHSVSSEDGKLVEIP